MYEGNQKHFVQGVYTMIKKMIFASMLTSSFAFVPVVANAGSYEDYFNGQEGVNAHVEGSLRDLRKFDKHIQGQTDDQQLQLNHLERSENNQNKWLQRQQDQNDSNSERITSVEGQTDRQEGVIRQNRGRLDDHDVQLTDLKNHANRNTGLGEANKRGIEGLQGDVQAINDVNDRQDREHRVTDERSIRNTETIAGVQTSLQETRDTVTSNDQASRDRDANLYSDVRTVESDSLQRDITLESRIEQYNDWTIDQFNGYNAEIRDVKAGVDQNARDIANERHERKEMGKDLSAGIANAMAIGSHHFDTNYQGFQLSVSSAGYRGATAQSLSAGGALNRSVFGSVAVSNDSRGNQGYSVNGTFKF